MPQKQKRRKPLQDVRDLDEEVQWDKWGFKEEVRFIHCCTLVADVANEKLIAEVRDEVAMQRHGIVYVLVVNDRILKIGQSLKSFKKRLVSYNAGTRKNHENRTTGGANFFIKQSLLNFNRSDDAKASLDVKKNRNSRLNLHRGDGVKVCAEVYGYLIGKERKCILFKGTTYQEKRTEVFPSAKTAEGTITRRFEKEYRKLPIGNSQR